MDRNNLFGLVLIFVIFAGSFYLMKPSEEELKQEQIRQDSSIKEAKQESADTSASVNGQDNTGVNADSTQNSGVFGSSSAKGEEEYVLENDKLIVRVSNKGGSVKSVEVKGEETFDGKPLFLFEADNNKYGFLFRAENQNISTSNLYFQKASATDDGKTLSLQLNYDDNRYIEYKYALADDGYNLTFDVNAVGIHHLIEDISKKTITFNWETTLLQKERSVKSERERSTLFYRKTDGKVDNLKESSDDDKKISDNLQWIAYKQHFFSAILLSEEGFQNSEVAVETSSQDSVVKTYKTEAELAFSTQTDNHYSFNFFFGPNQYKVLKTEGHQFEKVIKMGWGPMSWINKYLTVPVFSFLDSFHLSYGLVILILTLLLKGALFPLTYKSYQSMAKMRVLKPQLDAIKEKVGSDNQMLQQQEQMKLYKQAGVNPLGGCLPMLLQMPFTLSFFFFFPNLFELRGQSFLWVQDLSTYDAPISFAPIFGIGHISFMCILMTLTTVLTTWYNNSTSGATGQMKYIGYIMPFFFFFILNSFPAGLNYYYFLGAVFTFLTQVLIRSRINDEVILAKIEEHKKNPKAKKKSSFQQRMEEMMRQQQANQRKGK